MLPMKIELDKIPLAPAHSIAPAETAVLLVKVEPIKIPLSVVQ